MDAHRRQQQKHFLIVTYPIQSHINPALHLARRLALATGALVTFSTAASAHLLMFPQATSADEVITDGTLTYIPYSDAENNSNNSKPHADRPACRGLAAVITDLATSGHRVTCVIYTILLTWAADVARQLGIPRAQYWIQPATTFVSYYYYFHGYGDLIDSHRNDPLFLVKLPGLPSLQIRELPSFIAADANGPYSMVLDKFRADFESMDMDETNPRPKILVNTSDELEPDALSAIDGFDLIAVGPILPSLSGKVNSGLDLFKPDEKRYMEWLDGKEERSVVYVSFGSIYVLPKRQVEEILKGLKESGRPYLWVLRKDCRYEGVELDDEEDESTGMVVCWCSQVNVLSHPSVGCFVTHCGWNSTMESLVSGVPTVGVPQWSDQGTNVMLMEKVWGNGVRGDEVMNNEERVLQGEELRRCLDLVMGDGDRGAEIRRKSELWKDKAKEAVEDDGSSDRNLMKFVEDIGQYK